MTWHGLKSQTRETHILNLIAGPFVKWIAIAFIVLGVLLAAYLKGRSDVKAQWELERQSIRLAGIQAEAAIKERMRIAQIQVSTAQRMADEANKNNRARASTERERMRNSTTSGGGVPSATTATCGCYGASGPTRDELLGYGEAVIRLAESATAARAAVDACYAAWPK